MHGPETLSGVQKIVRTAEHTDVPRFRAAAQSGKGFDVVQLEKRPRIAAPAICSYESAPTAIPPVNLSPDAQ
jgi:hypothetical protein